MLTTMHITQQGESHIRRGVECQDSSYSEFIQTTYGDYAVGAIADGVGSCLFSGTGSKIAVESSFTKIKAELNQFNSPPEEDRMLQLIGDAFQHALNSIYDHAEHECLSPVLMETTLTIAVYEAESHKLYYGHSGDGGIVALHDNASYKLITKRHKGDAYNIVIPLTRKDEWEFGMAKDVAACALLTDGLLDYSVGDEAHANRVYWPFFCNALLLRIETEEDALLEKKGWEDRLSNTSDANSVRKYVDDDLTLLIIQNQEALAGIEEVWFDQQEWNKQTQLYQKQKNEALYAEYLATRCTEDQPVVEDSDPAVKEESCSNKGSLMQFIKTLLPKQRLRCMGIVSGTRYICERDPVHPDIYKTNFPNRYMRLVQNPSEKVKAAIAGVPASFPSAEGNLVVDLVCTVKAGYIGYVFTTTSEDRKE